MRHFNSWFNPFLSGFLLFATLSIVACTPTQASPAADQLSRGQPIYEQGCATAACHGVNGEGIRSGNGFRVWPLVGEEFQRRNPTAQVIFDVVRSGGEPSLRALTDQQIYDAIAYELSLNDVELSEPLDSQNAPVLSSGATGVPETGRLFPPPGNGRLIFTWHAPALPIYAENSDLHIRLTQMALAASIGETVLPAGESFILVVFTLEVLAEHPIEVGPQNLRLATEDGQMLEPLEIGLDYPVARFYPQTIQPEHGTAALAIFALPETAKIGRLLYTLPTGQQVILEIAQ
ncbi:MAG TPA: cytochrome c [Anaerolineales bacterium]|nr:cytochrome c [Anaerolineales bacterium]